MMDAVSTFCLTSYKSGHMQIDKQNFISLLSLISDILCIQEYFLMNYAGTEITAILANYRNILEKIMICILCLHSKIQWSNLDGVKGVLLQCGRKDSQNI